jgi:hypothetical protein
LADIFGTTKCYLRSWRAAYTSDLPTGVLEAEAEKRRAFDCLEASKPTRALYSWRPRLTTCLE